MTLRKVGCWLRGRCQSPWTWAGAAGLATVQAFTGAVGAAAVWLLAHGDGLFTLVWGAGRVGWLPEGSPLVVVAFAVLAVGYLWRWTGGASS